MKRILLMSSCFLAAPAVWAQATITQSPAYQECTTLASTNPTLAMTKAEAWLKIDDSISARHCHAMALFGMRRFEEAGTALSSVRDAVSPENYSLRSYIARQAARAWLTAAQADKALSMLSGQITELANVKGDNAVTAKLTSELLLDRARLSITYGKMPDANKDLDQAVSLTPVNEEVLVERANLFEKLGDSSLARADAQAVLKLNSGNAQAKELMARLGGGPVVADSSAPVMQAAKLKAKPVAKKLTAVSEAP